MSERYTITAVYMRDEAASLTLTWPDCDASDCERRIAEAHARFKLNLDFSSYMLTVVRA